MKFPRDAWDDSTFKGHSQGFAHNKGKIIKNLSTKKIFHHSHLLLLSHLVLIIQFFFFFFISILTLIINNIYLLLIFCFCNREGWRNFDEIQYIRGRIFSWCKRNTCKKRKKKTYLFFVNLGFVKIRATRVGRMKNLGGRWIK